MANILVVYYSVSGNTARVARDIAQRTGADLESIRDREHGVGFFGCLKDVVDTLRASPAAIDPPARDPAAYDLVVIGTPVWVGRPTPAIRGYLRETAGKLKNAAFFVTSGATDVTKILPTLETLANRKAVASAGFNARELEAPFLYEAQLNEFLKAIRRPNRAVPAVPAHEHRLRAV